MLEEIFKRRVEVARKSCICADLEASTEACVDPSHASATKIETSAITVGKHTAKARRRTARGPGQKHTRYPAIPAKIIG